jgi:hypothetical protein
MPGFPRAPRSVGAAPGLLWTVVTVRLAGFHNPARRAELADLRVQRHRLAGKPLVRIRRSGRMAAQAQRHFPLLALLALLRWSIADDRRLV